jgi:hypothetical protein
MGPDTDFSVVTLLFRRRLTLNYTWAAPKPDGCELFLETIYAELNMHLCCSVSGQYAGSLHETIYL